MGDPGLSRWQQFRQALREDPGLWNDLGMAAFILIIAVVSVVGTINCCT